MLAIVSGTEFFILKIDQSTPERSLQEVYYHFAASIPLNELRASISEQFAATPAAVTNGGNRTIWNLNNGNTLVLVYKTNGAGTMLSLVSGTTPQHRGRKF